MFNKFSKKVFSKFFIFISIITTLLINECKSLSFENLGPVPSNFEISFSDEEIAIADNRKIRLLKEKKDLYQYKSEFIPKIAMSKDLIVISLHDKLVGINFEGKIIFETEIEAPVRNEIIVDNFIFVVLTNQVFMCFSKEGKLIWINREFTSINPFYIRFNPILREDLYVVTETGLKVLDQRSGMNLKEFKMKLRDSDLVHFRRKIFVRSKRENTLVDLDEATAKKTGDYDLFSKGFLYKYDGKSLKRKVEGTDDFSFDIKLDEIKLLADIIVGYNKNKLIIINGENIAIEDINFNIAKIWHKNGRLVIFDGKNIRTAKL